MGQPDAERLRRGRRCSTVVTSRRRRRARTVLDGMGKSEAAGAGPGGPRTVGGMLEIAAGTWIKASAIASVVAVAPTTGPDPEVLAALLDAEGAAVAVVAELSRPGPGGAAPRPGTRCYVRLLGETDWQPCASPATAVLEALAALNEGPP